MARLTKCKTCKAKIDRKAAACPHCGRKLRSTSLFAQLLTLVILLGGSAFVCSGCWNWVSDLPALPEVEDAEPSRFVDASKEAQKRRTELLKEFAREGLITKVNVPGTTPRVWVTSQFLVLEERAKNDCLEICYAWALVNWEGEGLILGDMLNSMPVIFDNGTPTGRRVGTYKPTRGYRSSD